MTSLDQLSEKIAQMERTMVESEKAIQKAKRVLLYIKHTHPIIFNEALAATEQADEASA